MSTFETSFWVMTAVAFVPVLGCAIWVYRDAKAIGISEEKAPAKSFELSTSGMGPAEWFLCVLLCWLLAFPLYLAKRQRLLASGRLTSVHTPAPGGVQFPPGWYPDPTAPGWLRWWDGYRWTEHGAPGPA